MLLKVELRRRRRRRPVGIKLWLAGGISFAIPSDSRWLLFFILIDKLLSQLAPSLCVEWAHGQCVVSVASEWSSESGAGLQIAANVRPNCNYLISSQRYEKLFRRIDIALHIHACGPIGDQQQDEDDDDAEVYDKLDNKDVDQQSGAS